MEKSSNNRNGSGHIGKGDSKSNSTKEEMGLGEKVRPSSGQRSSSTSATRSLQT